MFGWQIHDSASDHISNVAYKEVKFSSVMCEIVQIWVTIYYGDTCHLNKDSLDFSSTIVFTPTANTKQQDYSFWKSENF